MITGMASARLKLEHASRHLEALTKTVDEFASGGHFQVAVVWSCNHPDYECRGIVKNSAPTPDLIALQAADVVGNLRAALDHAVFTHVQEHCSNEGRPLVSDELRRIQFPILSGSGRIRSRDQFGPTVLDVLNNHQPRKSTVHPLFRLNKLVNQDKHRVMLITASAKLETDVHYQYPLEYVDDITELGADLRPGSEILRLKFRAVAPLEKHPWEYVDIGGGYPVAIDIPDTDDTPPILPTMNEIRDLVGVVLDELEGAGVS
ncbi:hypothetical protein BJY24_005678 [Nocardia transvalensis]|uniref:Uncharacterized protein n=1 Tax=Nocardia transvalensis TaxID=37333 RepID=A0A7W9PIG9_9NOCA|nr:hypothetical protein [Nocardia transvalensis]MBB5916766.1 hypothetical protein [Nocardia transvalensis]